ncbi:hypothetical protein GW17_00042542, partial [Ensete ventricosum]
GNQYSSSAHYSRVTNAGRFREGAEATFLRKSRLEREKPRETNNGGIAWKQGKGSRGYHWQRGEHHGVLLLLLELRVWMERRAQVAF